MGTDPYDEETFEVTPEEKQLLQHARARGLTPDEVMAASRASGDKPDGSSSATSEEATAKGKQPLTSEELEARLRQRDEELRRERVRDQERDQARGVIRQAIMEDSRTAGVATDPEIQADIEQRVAKKLRDDKDLEKLDEAQWRERLRTHSEAAIGELQQKAKRLAGVAADEDQDDELTKRAAAKGAGVSGSSGGGRRTGTGDAGTIKAPEPVRTGGPRSEAYPDEGDLAARHNQRFEAWLQQEEARSKKS